MPSTRTVVIGALLVIGVSSFAYQICTDDKVTLGSTLLLLGTECLKTAVFFILLDNLIARSEKRASDFENAREALLVGSWTSSEEVNRLFDRVVRSGAISISLGRTASFNHLSLELVGRTFKDSNWTSADFSSVSFEKCKFERVRFSNVAMTKSVLDRCQFRECEFDGVDFTDTAFIGCTFESVSAKNIIGDPNFTNCAGYEPLQAGT